jgi:hypothetical protein
VEHTRILGGDQLLADIQLAVNDNEDHGRREREVSAQCDERLAKARQEVSANAIIRILEREVMRKADMSMRKATMRSR